MANDYGREAAEWLAKLPKRSAADEADTAALKAAFDASMKELQGAVSKLEAQIPSMEEGLKSIAARVGAKPFDPGQAASAAAAPAANVDLEATLKQFESMGTESHTKLKELFEQHGYKFELPPDSPELKEAAKSAPAAPVGDIDLKKMIDQLNGSAAASTAKLMEMMRGLGIDPENYKPPKLDEPPRPW